MSDNTVENVIIIGSGPSGYGAAIYLSRSMLKPLVLSGEKSGGQLMLTTEVENYPGFPKGILGPQLMMDMRAQAERFGTRFADEQVVDVDFSVSPFVVKTTQQTYMAKSVLISTGAESLWLNVPGESAFIGRGVSTCAVCDAAFFKDKRTFVIGGGDSAMEDTLALTKFAKEVTVIHRRDSFKASKIMQERVIENPKVKVMWNATVKEIKGNAKVESILVEHLDTKTVEEIPADGVFLAIGHKPSTEVFKDKVRLNKKGFVVTRLVLDAESLEEAGKSLKDGLLEYPTMTSVPGVFAAGDVVDFRYKQAITATGYGVMASLDIEKWLESQE